ncbi:MAG TPA: YbhB/YbcL family Raf kinase inhibitor-like protein [Verrucomicrobiae bacterium]|nr:YbhB/YbcL family Raf kinase inhibitor-like protein [Verrucomicrobiae bacterium]
MNSAIARILALTASLFAVATIAAAQQAPPTPPPGPPPSLVISSTSFGDGTRIPQKYTCTATTPPPSGPRNISTGISPELEWRNVPKGTVTLALIMHDPDAHIAKAPTDITHWLVFNIPADATSLPEGVAPEAPLPNGALQGTNITGKAGFQGSCAGPGSPHHYTFELLALDAKLDLPQGATREQIQDAVKGHVLGSAVYIGLFNR